MRPIPEALVGNASAIISKYRKVHGAPVHIGDPAQLGIADLQNVDFGDPPEIRPGEVPVFWACGVTPQMAIRRVKLEMLITHAPGYMFITDRDKDLAQW